jgi:hypothetical protein
MKDLALVVIISAVMTLVTSLKPEQSAVKEKKENSFQLLMTSSK